MLPYFSQLLFGITLFLVYFIIDVLWCYDYANRLLTGICVLSVGIAIPFVGSALLSAFNSTISSNSSNISSGNTQKSVDLEKIEQQLSYQEENLKLRQRLDDANAKNEELKQTLQKAIAKNAELEKKIKENELSQPQWGSLLNDNKKMFAKLYILYFFIEIHIRENI